MASICIYGAGAVGGWLAALLAQAGNPVSVVARGATLEALRRHGMRLDMEGRSIAAPVRASDRPESLGPHDILVLGVKAPALPGIAASVGHLMHADTLVMPAMNGVPWWFSGLPAVKARTARLESVDPGGALSRAMPIDRVAGCAVHISSALREPGHVRHNAGKELIIGAADPAAAGRTDTLAAILSAAGIIVTRSAQIERDIWFKLWGNMTLNPISALTGATMDRILDDPLLAAFIVRAMEEARDIGRQMGIEVDDSIALRLEVTRRLGAVKTSMLQDVEAGRRPEIDALVGAARELGMLFGVATPSIDTLLGLSRLQAKVRNLYGDEAAAGALEG